ncbi:MAG: 3-phosphoglycerate dehydrogenase [Oscillospiraceae bacterium]|nr:3-phosphoglycerate dehydrogenase [Oscillospiraceae bacterium]
MFIIKTLNKISPNGLKLLPGELYRIDDSAAEPDGIIVRSADMLQESAFPTSLKAIARAGAGTNNIPVDRCAENGIVVFNTPGANANAVKELVICALLLASRDIAGGIQWAVGLEDKSQVGALVEKKKSAFAGPELFGKTLGVIGLGAIGALVAKAATDLGMTVIGYDPYLNVAAACRLDPAVKVVDELKSVFAGSDYITIHVPQTPGTKGMLDAQAFAAMKDGVRLVNIARGGLVNDADLLGAIDSGKVSRYVTDFPDADLVGHSGVVCIPHLGASTPESEENCAVMAAKEMRDYLENGNINCSVNFPAVNLERGAEHRVCVAYRDDPELPGRISGALTSCGCRVSAFKSASNGKVGYAIFDVDKTASLPEMPGVIRVINVF